MTDDPSSIPPVWRSWRELTDPARVRAQAARGEFAEHAPLALDRRQALGVMGASLALAGLAGCSPPPEEAVPAVDQPEGYQPGTPRFYATAVPFEGYAQPVLATVHGGRPTKLDGNPLHPASRGASDPFLQAAVLQLYDPDRSRTCRHLDAAIPWRAARARLAGILASAQSAGGRGVRLLTGAVTSPTVVRQIEMMKNRLPQARWHVFEPAGPMHRPDGVQAALGRPYDLHYDLARARTVVTFDDDLLGPGPRQIAHAGAWSRRRRGEHDAAGPAQDIHVAESVPGLTGTVAGNRVAAETWRMAAMLEAVAAGVIHKRLPNGIDAEVTQSQLLWIDRAVSALLAAGEDALVAVGPGLDPRLQHLGLALNAHMGALGRTVVLSEPVAPQADGTLSDLVADMAMGGVETVVVLEANPLYGAPDAAGFAAAFAKVPSRIHVGMYHDETAEACSLHIPLAHPLEDWGDLRAVDGTASIVQPLIRPLFGGRPLHGVMAVLADGEEADPRAVVRHTWRESVDDAAWRRALHDGWVPGTAFAPVVPRDVAPVPQPETRHGDGLEVVFRPDPCVWDGRFANLGWLQELPKPFTKLTWDNAVHVAPALARRMGLEDGRRVELSIGHDRIVGAAWVNPGQAPGTIVLHLGYGRRAGGRVADGAGFDVAALRRDASPWHRRGAVLRALEGHMDMATTQHQHMLEEARHAVRHVDPGAAAFGHHELPSFYPPWPEGPREWAMVIDLDLCIGCNACVVACMSENTVPVVGKQQVAMGREMHWLRVDSYHTGTEDEPKTAFQPVPCMHCEHAPCEVGCPVNATVHGPEGLNQMIYNRCIGTRTCSSYCPYKVRRFNWYEYQAGRPESYQAQRNPEVTVRSRGVMEKCTYCVQRISKARIAAKREGRGIPDGAVTTACQDACPAGAIVFGNRADAASAVAKARHDPRHYTLLEELNTRPRTGYLARIRRHATGEG